jgi:hypothetical protein
LTQKPSQEEPGLKYIDEGDIQWAAGLFEGEGYLSHLGNGQWRLGIEMTDKDVLAKFADFWGIPVNGPYETKNNRGTGVKWKDRYSISTGARKKIFKIVCEIYPYLGIRRRGQCDEFLAWYAAKESMRFD